MPANIEVSLLALAARTATTDSGDQNYPHYSGVGVLLHVTAAPGAPAGGGLSLVLQGKNTAGAGNYYNLHTPLPAIQAVGSYKYHFETGGTTIGGDVAAAIAIGLPPTWRAEVVHGDEQSYTYELSFHTL